MLVIVWDEKAGKDLEVWVDQEEIPPGERPIQGEIWETGETITFHRAKKKPVGEAWSGRRHPTRWCTTLIAPKIMCQG